MNNITTMNTRRAFLGKAAGTIAATAAATVALASMPTSAAPVRELTGTELQAEIDRQIAAWLPMIIRAGIGNPISNPDDYQKFDEAGRAKIGAVSYIATRAFKRLDGFGKEVQS